MASQVGLPNKRDPGQVLGPPALAPAEPLAVEGYVRDRPADRLAEPCELEAGARGAPARLGLGVPDHDRRGGAGHAAPTLRGRASPLPPPRTMSGRRPWRAPAPASSS